MTSSTMPREIIGWIGWFLLAYVVAAVGSIASIEAKDFYALLVQPAWSPPPWLFGPVWTVLYALMAISAALVWRSGGFSERPLELGVFLLQLALNGLWSWLFFAWNLGAVAFAEVMLLWFTIVATLVLFWRVRPLAGALLVPYLLWVTFAAALNLSLWQMNPGVL